MKYVDAIIEEVKKLKETSAITEVFYLIWLSSTVVVKKKMVSGECMSILQASTNPVQRTISPCKIDLLVNSTSGYTRMSFLDAY